MAMQQSALARSQGWPQVFMCYAQATKPDVWTSETLQVNRARIKITQQLYACHLGQKRLSWLRLV